MTTRMTEAGPLQASTVEARVREVVAGTEYADAVQADIDMARRLGANGVPFFVIDRKYGISGAQAAETFLHALRTAYAAEEAGRSEEHTSELQSQFHLVCRLLLEKKKE